MTAVVPFYANKKQYEVYIEARETDIRNCKQLIKDAKKRIKNKEYYTY